MLYLLTDALRCVPDGTQPGETGLPVYVHRVCEWEVFMQSHGLHPAPTDAYENSVVCKMEPYREGLFGTFSIPVKGDYATHDHFACYIAKDALHFIDDDQTVTERIDALCIRTGAKISIGLFFSHFIEHLISDDMEYLSKLEGRIEALEEEIIAGNMGSFNVLMLGLRKEMADYHRCYTQLLDVGHNLQVYGEAIFDPHARSLFARFSDRVSRLLNEINLLREYSMQVREMYESLVDIRQNEIMRVLTVVTAIFLPLTLLAGWYGMNFRYMPELGWKLGYPFVIGLSVVIAAGCLWIFKKKKYW